MSVKSGRSTIFLTLTGAFLAGILVLVVMILLKQQQIKSLASSKQIEQSDLEQMQQYADRLEGHGKSLAANEQEHLQDHYIIETQAKEFKTASSLVNIRLLQPSADEDFSKFSLEFRNASIGPMVKYLSKLEEESFIVQRFWIYLGRDGKSWDAKALLVPKKP